VSSILLFLGCLAGIVLIGWVVSKLAGTKAQFLETFPLEPGERVLWEDLSADAYPVLTQRARYVTYARLGRGAVRVTTLRIIAGTKPLFGSKHMIEHVLYPADRPYPEEATGISGGFLKYGFQVLVFERSSVERHATDKHPFVELTLTPSVGSSTNLDAFRIYSDALAAFLLPE
jgi:hypothetical protein